MAIQYEADWRVSSCKGYCMYEEIAHKQTRKYCRWWAYPYFAFKGWAYHKKLWLYHFMNSIGIMHTPKYCEARFSDIWRFKPCK